MLWKYQENLLSVTQTKSKSFGYGANALYERENAHGHRRPPSAIGA